jgi:hypothetical protein
MGEGEAAHGENGRHQYLRVRLLGLSMEHSQDYLASRRALWRTFVVAIAIGAGAAL